MVYKKHSYFLYVQFHIDLMLHVLDIARLKQYRMTPPPLATPLLLNKNT